MLRKAPVAALRESAATIATWPLEAAPRRGHVQVVCCRVAGLSSADDKVQGLPLRRGLRADGTRDGHREGLLKVRVLATDVDGTLLDSRHRMSERAENALRLAQEQGAQVVIATGKARGPWVHTILPRLRITAPSVYLQGLLIYSADGQLLFERAMDADLAKTSIQMAVQEGFTHVAYCGNRILCHSTDKHTDRLIDYGEPVPEAVGPLEDIIDSTAIHKILYMGTDADLLALRPMLEMELAGRATLVTAVNGMLEVLPLGANKGAGVSWVMERLGVGPRQLMAIGDGENDIEMLRMARWGVAMGNALPSVKAAARYITASNDYDGLAQAVERLVLEPGYWCWD